MNDHDIVVNWSILVNAHTAYDAELIVLKVRYRRDVHK